MADSKKNLFLLQGNYFERKKALDKIKCSFPGSDIFIYDETASYKYVEQSIREFSCFSNNKIVIIKNWPVTIAVKESQPAVIKNFIKLFPNLPLETVLVFDGINTKSNKFISAVKEYGRAVEYEQKTDLNGLKSKIFSFFSQLDKDISDENAGLLAEFISLGAKEVDLDLAFMTLKQINELTGSRKVVKIDDINSVCSQRREFIIWSLFNALDDKNRSESMSLFKLALGSVSSIEGEINKIFFTLNWRYDFLLLARQCYDKKFSSKDAWSKLSEMNKMEREGSNNLVKMKKKLDVKTKIPVKKYTESMYSSFYKSYRGREPVITMYDQDHLLLIQSTIGKIYGRMRAECSESELIILMEFLFLVICGVIKHTNSINIFTSKYLLMA